MLQRKARDGNDPRFHKASSIRAVIRAMVIMQMAPGVSGHVDH